MPVWLSTALLFAVVFAVTLAVLLLGDRPGQRLAAASIVLGVLICAIAFARLHLAARAGLQLAWRAPGAMLAAIVLISVAVLGSAAFAADGVVTIPYGYWVSEWMPVIATGLGALVTWGLRHLPANLIAIFGNARVELLINNAIGYGLNAVEGATKGKTLELQVGNKVLREALQYAVENAPGWLLAWAGGPEGLAKKIFGRLDLPPESDGSVIKLVATAVKAGDKA
ncbi:hypothetical protein ACQR1Y_12295 [Bradyrhizobium sp. HKCCYLRH3099]|uniref:hypothetical protein n=1 Tax=unclassified Bradyrhizobium TaxID=2631580 RepID=UPI003EC08491